MRAPRSPKQNSMLSFIKENPDLAAKESRGATREEMILRSIVWQGRCKDSDKHVETSRDVSKTCTAIETNHEWSLEQLEANPGAKRAATLLELNSLERLPCPLTQSNDDHMCISIVPQKLAQTVNSSSEGIRVTGNTEISTEEEFTAAMNMLSADGNSSPDAVADGEQPDAAIIKSEPLHVVDKITKLNANKRAVLNQYQKYELDIQSIMVTIEGKKKDHTCSPIINTMAEHFCHVFCV